MALMNYFATTAKGLEEALADELRALDVRQVRPANGGVFFSGDLSDGYRACLWLRTANRVLQPIAEFPCSSVDALYEATLALPWNDIMTPEMTLAIDANVRDSAITHSRFAALKTKDAIVDQLRDRYGRRPNVDPKAPDLRVNLHLARNQATLSLDLAGAGLHRRGYRRSPNIAPLKETLAAGLVLNSGWDEETTFVDPMCGSGTLPLEAAQILTRNAPGLNIPGFGFQNWPDYDASLWTDLVQEARDRARPLPANRIFGTDRDKRAIGLARNNSESAGFGNAIRWFNADFAKLDPPAGNGTLLCNPPYGERIGDEEAMADFYRKIGDTLKQRWTGWTAWIFTGNLPMSKKIGLKPSRRIVLYNGPIECRLLKFELY